MKIACYTDIHNQQIMLNYPTVLRKSAVIAAENTLKEFGKTDLSIIGGDNVSDYPHWDRSEDRGRFYVFFLVLIRIDDNRGGKKTQNRPLSY